ncbi:hypothetical protein BC832DRAFT_584639 [Gaertneriomyces semiglobifer]|nr:hypothetical protein BC832DRAFT_584639 [Gaertneriomyces semiglobifer]
MCSDEEDVTTELTASIDVLDLEDLHASPCLNAGLKPCVPTYGPANLKGLRGGQIKLYCTCGLSKKQPWCDNSHKGTPFKPLKWKIPHDQTMWAICQCKYTSMPPFCDGTHFNLPLKYLKQMQSCEAKDKHGQGDREKLCVQCGWKADLQKGLLDALEAK